METQGVVWRASEEDVARSRTAEFMALHGVESYEELVRRSTGDTEWFWEAAVEYLGIPFSTHYHTLVDASDGPAFPRWFLGGRVNVSEACVDRWAAQDAERVALLAEREDGRQRTYTFGELLELVERAAGALAQRRCLQGRHRGGLPVDGARGGSGDAGGCPHRSRLRTDLLRLRRRSGGLTPRGLRSVGGCHRRRVHPARQSHRDEGGSGPSARNGGRDTFGAGGVQSGANRHAHDPGP